MALRIGLLIVFLCALLVNSQPDPTVSLPSGAVIGTSTPVYNQPEVTSKVNAYLGVPFASSPPERFSPPTSVKKWDSALSAQQVKPGCLSQFTGTPQAVANSKEFFNNPFGPQPAESEDCLYLNVYAPPGASPSSLKPVMFWLYGGNLQSGSASFLLYNASSLAVTQDVVVVSPNYRLNIFGFPGSSELPKGQQNLGLLDQRAALAWVQENIHAFGGDPQRVTIFGESAGGWSVKQLVAVPPNPRPFRAAILESQAVTMAASPGSIFELTAAHFGCLPPASRIECMRKPSATDIQAYINSASASFGPVKDDVTMASSVSTNLRNGNAAHVPVMLGTNANETTILLAAMGLYLNDGQAALEYAFNTLKINDLILRTAIISAIGANLDPFYLANRILTDTLYTCSSSALGQQIASAGNKVWRYRFNGVFPDDEFLPYLGAYHSSEIPGVFGSYPVKTQFGDVTPMQKELSAYMQGAWASFAKDPESGPGWPALGTAGGKELGDLGLGTSNETTNPLSAADYLCPLLTTFSYSVGNVD